MSDVLLKKASRTVPGTSRGNAYKGWIMALATGRAAYQHMAYRIVRANAGAGTP